MSIKIIMEFVAFSLILITLYKFYDTKPLRNDEIGLLWEEENLLKRLKIKDIFNENN
tara:strand:+ start:535 stop:705 length:171 start_codon:yes stop_codon:yes gene_type:complete